MRQFGPWGCAWNVKPFSWAIMICYSFLICPTNSWPLGVWMLGVFKLVSCKPGASRELDLRPPRPEKLQIYIIVVGTNFIFYFWTIFSGLRGLRASSLTLEAPGLHDTNLNTFSTQTPRGQEFDWTYNIEKHISVWLWLGVSIRLCP